MNAARMKTAGTLLLVATLATSLPATRATAQNRPADPAAAPAQARNPRAVVPIQTLERDLEKEVRAVEVELRALERQAQDPKKGQEERTRLEAQKKDVEAKLTQLRAKQREIVRTKVRSVPTLTGPSVLLAAPPEELITGEVMRLRQDIFLSLDRAISLELRDSTLRDAAAAMAQASGISIRVDEAAPSDKRLTVVAQSASLRNILQEVARQLGLLIAPDDEAKGVTLRPMPSLKVNEKETSFRAPNAPWSSAWSNLPTTRITYAPVHEAIASYVAGGQPLAGLIKAGIGTQPSGLVSMTGLGNDTFVVAHPLPGSEPGVVLTVYRIQGGQLRPQGSTVHRFDRGTGGVSVNPPPPGADRR